MYELAVLRLWMSIVLLEQVAHERKVSGKAGEVSCLILHVKLLTISRKMVYVGTGLN